MKINDKLKIKNLKLQNRKGFTMVEMMVVIGVLAIIFGVAVTIFTQIIATANRAHVANKVRENASFAMDQIVREIQGAERIRLESPTDLKVLNSTGDCQKRLKLDPLVGLPAGLTCSGIKIHNGSDCIALASGSFLTSDAVNVSRLFFTYVPATPNKIKIEMTVQQCNLASASRSEYSGTITLQQEVTLRNYAGYQ